MADEQVDILIKTTADQAGTQQTVQGLNKVKEAGTQAGEKVSGHFREMHKVFHSLNEVVPGLGVLMQAAFSPVGATISLAMIALRLFRYHMQEVNAEFKKMEEDAAKPATNRMGAFREAVVQAAVGMNSLHQALEGAARAEQTVKETTERTSAMFKEQFQAAGTLADAVRQNDLARLDEMHSAGLASDAQYALERLKIEQDFQDRKRQIEENAEMTEIMIRRRAAEKAEMRQPELTAAAEAAELKKTKALEDLGSLDKAGIDDRYKTTRQKLSEFEEKHNEEVGWFEQAGGAYATRQSLNDKMRELGRATYGTDQFGNFDQWQRLKWDADASKKEWQKAPQEEARRKVAADRATDEAARASRAAIDNEGFITSTGQELGDRRLSFDARHRANQETSGLQQETGVLQGLARANEGASRASKAIQDEIRRGGMILPEMLEAYKQNTNLVVELRKELNQVKSRLKLHPPSD